MGGSGYSVAFDPLDGSSIVDTNFAVGTIFGVWPGDVLTGITGRQQVGGHGDGLTCSTGRQQVGGHGDVLTGITGRQQVGGWSRAW